MKYIWTEERLEILISLYPIENTSHVAKILGISERSVKVKAAKLGLQKYIKSRWLEQAMYIRTHFSEKSYSEMAKELKISNAKVCRIVKTLGLRRTRREACSIMSERRGRLVKRERRRIIFGMNPVSNIKVVTNRPRIELRHRLRRKGYLPGETRFEMYIPEGIKRNLRQEAFGSTLGLRFIPVPQQIEKVYSQVI